MLTTLLKAHKPTAAREQSLLNTVSTSDCACNLVPAASKHAPSLMGLAGKVDAASVRQGHDGEANPAYGADGNVHGLLDGVLEVELLFLQGIEWWLLNMRRRLHADERRVDARFQQSASNKTSVWLHDSVLKHGPAAGRLFADIHGSHRCRLTITACCFLSGVAISNPELLRARSVSRLSAHFLELQAHFKDQEEHAHELRDPHQDEHCL